MALTNRLHTSPARLVLLGDNEILHVEDLSTIVTLSLIQLHGSDGYLISQYSIRFNPTELNNM